MPTPPDASLRNDAPRSRALRTLRGWVKDGVWAPGEMIPAEREISTRLGVGLGTVQRAIKVMEREGLIVKHPGRTRTVARPADADRGVLAGAVLVLSEVADVQGDPAAYGWAGYVASGVLNGLAGQQVHGMVLDPRSLDDATFERMVASGPLGLIVPELDASDVDWMKWAQRAAAAKLPVVVFGDEAGCEAFDRVVPDHQAGAFELAQWLIAQGRRDIHQMMPTGPTRRWALARRRGYEQALHAAGLTPAEPLLFAEGEFPGLSVVESSRMLAQTLAGALAPLALRGAPFDALMALTDGNVPALAAALKLLGRTPNTDVALVGYDDYWDQAPSREADPTPPLATVSKNNFQIGRELAALLLQRRGNQLPAEPQLRLVKPTLRVRTAW